MANEIRLKRGSGSDPGASDLVTGEIAVRTDTGKLFTNFTKNDGGSVVPIGISDGDKGDITVSSNGGTFTIDSGVVTSAKIANDTIVNADINSSAAIDGSKISPAFTSDITGTGNLTLTSTDAGSSAAPELELYRNSASPADADYLGQLKFTGESDDGSKEVYAKITGKIDDASSGTEDGIIEIAHRKAGSNVITARFKSTELQLLNGTNLDVDGTCTATTFSGSGASLTNLPAPDLTALTQHVRTNQQVGIGDSNGFDVALSNTGVGGFLTCNSGNISIKTASTNDDVKLLVSDDEGVFLDGADDAFKPITNNVVDLGSTSLKYKNVYAAAYYGDGSNLTGISAGATGGGSDEIFYENSQAVTTDYTITSGKNAMSAGPITINNGVSVTVPSGSTYTIV